MPSIQENLNCVLARIAAAERRAGRAPGSVQLVAVSKTFPAADVLEAVRAGQLAFGENRAQELVEKYPACAQYGEQIQWHFIGQLQKNKVKYILDKVAMVHSLDRMPLAIELERQLARVGRTALPVLVEVNMAQEATKAGLPAEQAEQLIREISAQCPHLAVQGLMTVAPYAPDPEQVRPVFARMRALFERMAALELPRVQMRTLSMGMSGDFEVAIEEGANLVRVGTAIFGGRSYPKNEQEEGLS